MATTAYLQRLGRPRRRLRPASAAVAGALAMGLLVVPAGPASAAWHRPSPPTSPGELTNAVLQQAREVFGADGELLGTEVFLQTYDSRGRLLTQSTETFDATGVQTRVRTVDDSYESGRLVLERTVTDMDGAGPLPAAVVEVRTTYDPQGRVSAMIYTRDEDTEPYRTELFSTDVSSRTATVDAAADSDGDGVDDSFVTTVTVYDPRGNVLSVETTFDDTLAGGSTFVSTYMARYGPQSRLIESSSTTQQDGDTVLPQALPSPTNPVGRCCSPAPRPACPGGMSSPSSLPTPTTGRVDSSRGWTSRGPVE